MKKYLISYGDDKFTEQKEFFKESAIASGFFDEVNLYGPDYLDQNFKIRFRSILNNNRGGGYWIWKPYIIKSALAEITDGDILIYCDAGCMINCNGEQRLKEYIDLLNKSESGSLGFELPFNEYEYTKKEIFDFFNTPKLYQDSKQVMATVILLRKCEQSLMLVDEWYNALCRFPLSFTDDNNPDIQCKEFNANRYDQSVFSIIRKVYGTKIIPDETYFDDFIREGQPYPFWATRIRG